VKVYLESEQSPLVFKELEKEDDENDGEDHLVEIEIFDH
jgi:hypothetical protein